MRNVKRFRRWILLPLFSSYVFGCGVFLSRGHWFESAVTLAEASVLVGIERWLKRHQYATSVKGEEAIMDYLEQGGGVSETESQLFTRGLVSSALTLSFGTVILALYPDANAWWLAGLKGLGVALLYPFVSILILIRVPRMLSKTKIDISLTILPRSIDCPHCSASMLLDQEERIAKLFDCPGCGVKIDMRELRTMRAPA